MGWGVLLGYSTVLLTNDTPVRPETGTAQAALNEPGPFENTAASSRLPRANAPWSDVGLGSAHAGAPARDRLAASPAQPGIRPVALKQDYGSDAPRRCPRCRFSTDRGGGLCRRLGAERGGMPPRARGAVDTFRRGSPRMARGLETTVCTFRDGRRMGASWSVAASCSDGGRRWTSQVKLIVEGDRADMVERQGRRLLRPVQSPRRVNTADTEVSPALCRDGLKYRAKVSRIHVGQIRPRHDI